MNEKKFIELLNLYVDQEISKPEALALEEEIQRSPERRRIYQQYCRIHRASITLAESYKSDALPQGSKLARAARAMDEKVALLPQRGGRSFSWAWASGLGLTAAAACVALVVVRSKVPTNPTLSQATNTVVQSEDTHATVSNQMVAASGNTSSNKVFQPVYVSRDWAAEVSSLDSSMQSAKPSLAWLDEVSLPAPRALLVEELVFKAKAETQDSRTFRSDRPIQTTVETTAFQFQK